MSSSSEPTHKLTVPHIGGQTLHSSAERLPSLDPMRQEAGSQGAGGSDSFAKKVGEPGGELAADDGVGKIFQAQLVIGLGPLFAQDFVGEDLTGLVHDL